MIERLATVIYWACCGVAAFFVIGGAVLAITSGRDLAWASGLGVSLFGALVFGGGWSTRYILTGKR